MKETQPKKNKFVKVILLLLIISIVINIKLSIDNKNTQEIKNNKQYYNLRNQANKQILNGDYELAINTYKKIKENYPLKDNFDSSIKLIVDQKNRSNEYDSLKEKTNTYIKDIKNLESENIIIYNHYKKLLQDFNTKNNKLTFNKTTSDTPPSKKPSTNKDILNIKNYDGISIKYIGEVKNKKANGFGFAIFDKKGFYEGQWKNNRRNGEGFYYWQNGDKYEGSYSKGKREGKGTYYFKSGEIYLGNWSNDLRNGFGTILDNKGKIIFEGEWKNDKMIPSKNK